MTVKPLLITLSFFLFHCQVKAQENWVSPCPRLFVYEGKSNEPNRWYGIITLLSNTDVSGVWLRVILDRPARSLGNWFGKVKTKDSVEFLVRNHDHQLKGYVPHPVRFYIIYDPDQPVPRLIAIRLNAKTICPEDVSTVPPPFLSEAKTSSHFGDADVGRKHPRPIRELQTNKGSSSNKPKDEPSIQSPPASPASTTGDVINRPTSLTAQIDNEELNSVCGTVITQPGQETHEGEFPWHAALYHTNGSSVQRYICGGSLISKSHVITAGHCVTKYGSETPLDPVNVFVYLGKYHLKRFNNKTIQGRNVAEIIPHPQYSGEFFIEIDIALLKLSAEVEITDYVRPICLWQESPDIATILKKEGNVVGWGFDENGKLSEELMQAKIPIFPVERCSYEGPFRFPRFDRFDHNYYCSGTSGCIGGSGDGMVFPRDDSKDGVPVWQLRGLIATSLTLQSQKCRYYDLVVFTDTAKYLDWIRPRVRTESGTDLPAQNVSSNSREHQKETINMYPGSCQMPSNPRNGEYTIGNNPVDTFKPGSYVSQYASLKVVCNQIHKSSRPDSPYSTCFNETWLPKPANCSLSCPAIISTTTTEVSCALMGKSLNSCMDPVEETVATVTCKPFHEEPTLKRYPLRVCRNGIWNRPLPECYPVCGNKRPRGKPNIIGGQEAIIGDYPWHVGIYDAADKKYLCGDSIVSVRLIISAAHCFTDLSSGDKYPKENYLVAAGKYYRTYDDPRDQYEQHATAIRQIQDIHIPVRYKGQETQYEGDLAVVILKTKLELSIAVQPVCIDWLTEFEYQQISENNNGVVVGWGQNTEDGKPSEELKELNIPVVPFDRCYAEVPKPFRRFITHDKVCVGFLGNATATCLGDSGGGLTFPHIDERYYLRGIVSTSPATLDGACDSNQYAAYTLVSKYIDFIQPYGL